jgi:hypothetical protein
MKKTFFLLLAIVFLFSCSSNKKIVQKTELSFPIYGNYCGPLYPPKGMNPIALDKVDLACKNHDKCYDDHGYLNKNCDLQIMKDLKLINPQSETEKLAQRLLIFYFQESSKI